MVNSKSFTITNLDLQEDLVHLDPLYTPWVLGYPVVQEVPSLLEF